LGASGLYRLDSAGSSLVIDARGTGMPRACHWGARLPDGIDLAALADAQARPVPKNALDEDTPPSLLPESGLGAFNRPALSGARSDGGGWATAFQLDNVELDGDGLTITLSEPNAALSLVLGVALDPSSGVVTRSARLSNTGTIPYHLDWCAAGALQLPADAGEGLVFDGQWSREFHERRVTFGQGVFLRENRRGRTSHDAFPGLIVGRPGFHQETGEVWGFHLGWSGNHAISLETSVDGTRQVQLGELLKPGEVILQPGETYDSPTAYAAHSAQGLDGMAAAFHGFVRTRMLNWPGGSMRPRPVHLNTWEAVYFDHEMDRLTALADRAAALGVERFVLDDGWFGARDDDTTSLGDWVTDRRKYPDGLTPLIDHVRGLGMEFGLWVEPEMISPDSDLYRAHPEWALNLDPYPRRTGRHQLVLNLTRPDAAEHIYQVLDGLLRDHAIDYLKWDMNRDLAAAGSDGVAAYRRQTLALYALLDRLRAAHPSVEIESCASGGARVDFGILPYVHRYWPSDCNDPLERVSIQNGFLRFFPPEVMGAHVGPSPVHTTGRRATLAFRAAVALFGHFGMEMDITQLDDQDAGELASWIARHKRFRTLLHGNPVLRIEEDRAGTGRSGLGVVDAAAEEALYGVYQTTTGPFRIPPPLRLPGLDAGRDYRLRLDAPPPDGARLTTPALKDLAGDGLVLPGAVLATIGVQLPALWPESALILHLRAETS